jgi:hypothetical protein
MSMNEKWAESLDSQVEFDTSLFDMTEEERIEIYGEDPVENLREMSIRDRFDRYGRDYSEYL